MVDIPRPWLFLDAGHILGYIFVYMFTVITPSSLEVSSSEYLYPYTSVALIATSTTADYETST